MVLNETEKIEILKIIKEYKLIHQYFSIIENKIMIIKNKRKLVKNIEDIEEIEKEIGLLSIEKDNLINRLEINRITEDSFGKYLKNTYGNGSLNLKKLEYEKIN
jgi:hypothetical protein